MPGDPHRGEPGIIINGDKKMKDIVYSEKFDEDIIIEITHYKPGRPAPACSNPSSPAYSDPGDDVEVEFKMFLMDDDGEIIREINDDEMDYDQWLKIWERVEARASMAFEEGIDPIESDCWGYEL